MFRGWLILVKESDKCSRLNDKYQILLGKVDFEGTDQYYLLDSQSRKYQIKVKLSEGPNLRKYRKFTKLDKSIVILA